MIIGVSDRASFDRLRRTRLVGRSGPLTIKFVPLDRYPGTQSAETECNEIRIAFSISRRVGTAVERNRLRRRLREIVAAIVRSAAPVAQQGVYMIIAAPGAKNISFTELESHVVRAMRRIHSDGAGLDTSASNQLEPKRSKDN